MFTTNFNSSVSCSPNRLIFAQGGNWHERVGSASPSKQSERTDYYNDQANIATKNKAGDILKNMEDKPTDTHEYSTIDDVDQIDKTWEVKAGDTLYPMLIEFFGNVNKVKSSKNPDKQAKKEAFLSFKYLQDQGLNVDLLHPGETVEICQGWIHIIPKSGSTKEVKKYPLRPDYRQVKDEVKKKKKDERGEVKDEVEKEKVEMKEIKLDSQKYLLYLDKKSAEEAFKKCAGKYPPDANFITESEFNEVAKLFTEDNIHEIDETTIEPSVKSVQDQILAFSDRKEAFLKQPSLGERAKESSIFKKINTDLITKIDAISTEFLKKLNVSLNKIPNIDPATVNWDLDYNQFPIPELTYIYGVYENNPWIFELTDIGALAKDSVDQTFDLASDWLELITDTNNIKKPNVDQDKYIKDLNLLVKQFEVNKKGYNK